MSGADAVYHCMTRVVNGEMLLDDESKEILRKQLWQAAEFCGVEILTYCLLANHFHVLVRVPDRSQLKVSDGELMRRYRRLYPKPTKYQLVRADVLEAALKSGGKEADGVRRQLLGRMHDVSEFMKTVKQRFSVWYNRSHGRYGTLWAERFKSVLVEGTPLAAGTVAAYIDLNPVRAGLVDDPKDYRWCGYAEAVAGHREAAANLRFVLGSVHNFMAEYRKLLFGKGGALKKDGSGAAMDHHKVLEVLNKDKGCLPVSTVLRCRVRYFTDGAVLGSKAFVKDYLIGRKSRGELLREGRPIPLCGADWGELLTGRGMRRQVFS